MRSNKTEQKPPPLFQAGNFPDVAYCNLRDLDHCVKWKAFCEVLWKRYAPYADPHFLSEIRIQFNQRFWEMYLAVAFLDRGYTLHKHRDGGPEFGIDVAGRRYWFDAVAPTSGSGADAVPEPEFGARVARKVPQEQIILRLTNAVSTKQAKWKVDLAKKRVVDGDGFVVAINGRSIMHALPGSDMLYIVKALYGFGDLAIAIDYKTLEVVETKHLHRPAIAKASGVNISSQPFASEECPEISAVLYSHVDAANLPSILGGDFLILHNTGAQVPLALAALPCAQEYWLDDTHLNVRDFPQPPGPSVV